MISCTFNDIPKLQKKYGKFSPQVTLNLSRFFMMKYDIMSKVVSVKEEKWSEEKEWRKVIQFKNKDEICYYDGKPYLKCYLDKQLLTGITVFCSKDYKDRAQKEADDIKRYILKRGYNAEVRVEII